MEPNQPLATHVYRQGELDDALEFLKRTRSELRTLRRAKVWTDRIRVYDVNGDYFEVTGVGFPDPEIIPILLAVHTVFDPAKIQAPIAGEYKEFLTGRRHPWAEDRVM